MSHHEKGKWKSRNFRNFRKFPIRFVCVFVPWVGREADRLFPGDGQRSHKGPPVAGGYFDGSNVNDTLIFPLLSWSAFQRSPQRRNSLPPWLGVNVAVAPSLALAVRRN